MIGKRQRGDRKKECGGQWGRVAICHAENGMEKGSHLKKTRPEGDASGRAEVHSN